MFGTKIRAYSHPHSTGTIFRSEDELQVPDNVKRHVEFVYGGCVGGSDGFRDGLNTFPAVRKPRKLRDDPGIDVTPLVIKSLYNITATGSGKTASGQAVAEFEQAYFYPSDLPIFEEKFGLPTQGATIIGPNDPETGIFFALVVEVKGTLARPLWMSSISLELELGFPLGSFRLEPMVPCEEDCWITPKGLDLITWALNVTSTPNAPTVHSISWGSGESDFDPDLMNRVNIEFQKLASLGFSIMVASGDEGTGHTGKSRNNSDGFRLLVWHF